MAHRAPERSRNWGWFWFALLLTVALFLAGWSVYDRSSPTAVATSSTAAEPLPPACADALALARVMADHVGPLAQAANDHVSLMELLQLTIEGKPGGIDGKEAFRRSEPQMAVMEEHGPDAEVQVRRFNRLAKKCPLR